MEIWKMVEIWGRLTEQQSRNQTKVLRVFFACFAKKNPFLPAKDLRVSSSTEQPGRNQNGSHRRDFCFLQQTNSEVFGPLRLTRARTREKFFPSCKGFSTLYYGLTRKTG